MVCWINKAITRCATSLAMLLLLGCGGDPLVLVGETVVDNATEVAEEPLADVQVAEDSLSDDSLSDGSIEVVESVADDPVQIADDPIEVASNSLPVVSFVSPGDGETLDFGSLLSVTVNATDSDGSVGSVSLSVDGSLVRQDNTSPFQWGVNDSVLQNLDAGTYQLTAVATDDAGDSTQASITITIAEREDPLSDSNNGSDDLRVLIFTETRGFRHNSIPDAIAALEALADSAGIETDLAGDSSGVFTDANLANYDAVIWSSTTGDVLNNDEQAAFERYIRAGGGYMGIHAASDTEFNWPWYGELVGAYFDRHPSVQQAVQVVEDNVHPSTAHLGSLWTRTDEWYDYQSNPRSRVNVLLSLDEESYNGGGMGSDHPSAWFHEFQGGRSWYTGGGHTSGSYAEDDFRAHLLGGLLYVTGVAPSVADTVVAEPIADDSAEVAAPPLVDDSIEVVEQPVADDPVVVMPEVVIDGSKADDSTALVEEPVVEEPVLVAVNRLPVVSFSVPVDGEMVNASTLLSVSVDASDSDGSIANVRLSVDGAFVRQENVIPYQWGEVDSILQNLSAGTHQLIAVATDDAGDSAEATITITVIESEETAEPVAEISGGDLLSLHYDNAPDKDDGHALVAGRALVDNFGVRAMAVNGTYGVLRRGDFNTESQRVFDLTWPNGLDAFNDRIGSVATAVRLWSETITNGGTVYVAEGGPSDFTAEVLRELPVSQRSSVTVVQHSDWNENNTDNDNLNFVRDVTNYIRIDDGNQSNNGTADLETRGNPDDFIDAAFSSLWAVQWQAAFDYLDPDAKLDFSDTVEVLYILDVPLSRVSDWVDFADEFLRNTRQAVEQSIQNRNFPQTWVSPLSQ